MKDTTIGVDPEFTAAASKFAIPPTEVAVPRTLVPSLNVTTRSVIPAASVAVKWIVSPFEKVVPFITKLTAWAGLIVADCGGLVRITKAADVRIKAEAIIAVIKIADVF